MFFVVFEMLHCQSPYHYNRQGQKIYPLHPLREKGGGEGGGGGGYFCTKHFGGVASLKLSKFREGLNRASHFQIHIWVVKGNIYVYTHTYIIYVCSTDGYARARVHTLRCANVCMHACIHCNSYTRSARLWFLWARLEVGRFGLRARWWRACKRSLRRKRVVGRNSSSAPWNCCPLPNKIPSVEKMSWLLRWNVFEGFQWWNWCTLMLMIDGVIGEEAWWWRCRLKWG